MRLLFIMPLSYSVYPFQIGALSAYLKKVGHDVEYLELLLQSNLDDASIEKVKAQIESFKPHLIGFSAYEMTFEWIKEISSYIKSKWSIPIVVGGYLATLNPEAFNSVQNVDYICMGEGELIIEKLLKKLADKDDIDRIKGICIFNGGKLIKNPPENLIENIDELPFTDREIINFQEHIGYPDGKKDVYLSLLASRGCPYKCSYCSNQFLRSVYKNQSKYVRFRDPYKVIEEIQECENKYKFNKIIFEDDMFTVNIKWLKKFGELYTKNFSYPFRCNIRPESATKEKLNLLKEMGCIEVSMGLESGDEKIRKKVLGRNMPDQLIFDAAKNLKEVGIRLRTYNMVGIPDETYLSLFKTIRMNFSLAPVSVQTTIYFPLRGTTLGDRCYNEGMVDLSAQQKIKTYAYETSLVHNNLPKLAIIAAKWLNSATALRGGGVVQMFKLFLSLILSRLRFRTQ